MHCDYLAFGRELKAPPLLTRAATITLKKKNSSRWSFIFAVVEEWCTTVREIKSSLDGESKGCTFDFADS